MIKVEKIGESNYPNIRVSNGINSFVIARAGFPDPVWYPEINAFENEEDITFKIIEEDGDIHTLFVKLYQDIIDGNIFPLTKEELENRSPEEVKKLKRENAKRKAQFRADAKNSGLVTNGIINCHSEDYDAYDYASVLTIKRIDNEIEIMFSKNKRNPDESFPRTYSTYHVRITEVGGIYGDFFIPFIKIHRYLQSLNLEDNYFSKSNCNRAK